MSSRKPRVAVPNPNLQYIRQTKLIDRIKEMHTLKEAADRAGRGQGGVVFLHGEAGIGKTRLARELMAYAHSRDMQVLSGRCPALFRMDGVPPYILWKEVIRDYLETCTPEQLYRVIGFYPAEVSKLVPELTQKLRVVPKSIPISSEHKRDRLYEAVSQFITNISREAPLLVVLDDLQWADQSSLLLLHYLARGVYDESLLLLGAYRDSNVGEKHPLSAVFIELNRERLLQSVPLKRLSFDDVSEMIRRILEQDDIERDFCAQIYSKTQGNPFFVEEVIKSLKEEEVICREKNKWKIKKVPRIAFPETVKSVLKARIERLDDESKGVLTTASFIGKDFAFEALRGVTNVEENRLLEIMEKMLESGLIKENVIRGEEVYSFFDKIVRDVVYEEVSRLRRRKLHGVIGSALEKAYAGKIDAHFEELASHFREAEDKGKALDYFLKAGEKAAKVYANSEAASYFQSALELFDEKEHEPQEKGRVLERLGDIKRLVGEYDACMRYWNEALLLWKQEHEKERAARLHREMANVLLGVLGDAEKAEKHGERALKILKTEPERVELASLYADLARLSWFTGDMARSLSWAEKALELAERLNASEVIANSYTNLALVFDSTGNTKKAREYLEKALKIALDNDYPEIAVRIYNNIASALPAEENERVLECLEKGFELAKKVGIVHWISWIGANLAWMYIGMGTFKKAQLLAEKSVALDRKTSNMLNLSASLRALGAVDWGLDQFDKSEQCYEEALSISQRLNNLQQIGLSYGSLGWFHLQKGEHVKAKEFYEKMLQVFEESGAEYQQVSGSVGIIWTYIELGEIEKAENLLKILQKFALKSKDKDLSAWTDALTAMLLRAQKKWKESLEHFEKSLQRWEEINARQWSVHRLARVGLSEHARVYMERDQQGDREKAHKLLSQALELYQKMGAKKEIEEIKSRMFFLKTGQRLISEPTPMAEVPEAARPRQITTGFSDLDGLLLGGIPCNYAVVLTSPSCDERDLLIRKFLEAGARSGQITFHFVTKATEAKVLAEEFQSNFYLFMCNPQADQIIGDLPNVFKLKGVGNLTDINIALTSAFRKLDKSPKGPRIACIDIVSDVLLQHHAVNSRMWLNALIPELKSKGFTVLAVMDPEMHPTQEVRAILDLFDGEISAYERRSERGLEKFVRIKRLYNLRYLESELPLNKEELQNHK